MNSKIICYLLGRICFGSAVALLLPLLASFYYQEGYYVDLLIAAVIPSFVAIMLRQYAWDANMKDTTSREWISVVVFGWLLVAAFCSVPYILLDIVNPVDAYFESMSGLTTTGITTITNLDELPKSILFWRNLTGWFGGIASIVVFIAILPQFAGSSAYLFNSDANGNAKVGVLPRIMDTALTLLLLYFVLTVILAVTFGVLGLTPFEAVNYALSTVSTTGFAIHDSNMAYWEDSIIILVTAFFMLVSGGNFALYYHALQHGPKVLWRDMEFKGYLIIISTISLLISIAVLCTQCHGFLRGLYNAIFQTISFASTTGYTVGDYNHWSSFPKLLLGLLLVIGGCSGSAASGLKIGRVIVLIKILFLELNRILHPQMLIAVKYNNRELPISYIMNISRFFFVYIFAVVLFSFPLAAAGMAPPEAFFGAASCLSNNGPAFGMLGAVNSYADLPVFSKFLMCFGMLLGRLEIFIVLAMFNKEFWRKTKRW